jgi:HEPN domain-containing protein
MKAPLARIPTLFLPFLLLAPAASPQEPEEGVKEDLTRLFDQVHKDLKEIDRLLLEAGNGREAAEKSAEALAGMKKLLERVQGHGSSAVKSIEEILRKAPT